MAEQYELYGMTREEICALAERLGEKPYRGKQLFKWLYRGAAAFDDMTDLSKNFRLALAEHCTMTLPHIESKQISRDKTVKYAFRLSDGEVIEAVVMDYHHGNTICISTQAGCNMGCTFCASAVGGKTRDLTAGEMIGQVLAAGRDLNLRIGNVVFMGIGEPLDNLAQVLQFMKIANHEEGLQIGYRHFTLSTCGLCDKIDILAEHKLPITLSVSIHAPFDEQRSDMMPVNKKYPLQTLVSSLARYQAATGRRISVEYALIEGKNDTPAHAKELMRLFQGLMYHVNLIPVNPAREGFVKSGGEDVKRFLHCFSERGIPATVRRELGGDIDAACGQLRHKMQH